MATIDELDAIDGLRIVRIESLPFGQNTYVFFREGAPDCAIVDPGFEPEAIVDWVAAHGLVPTALLVTHGHSDHIAGNAALRDRWPSLPIIIGRHDAAKLTNPAGNLSAAFGMNLISPPVVFGGDVLFAEGVGRSDFPDGDFAALAAGIRGQLYTLPDETIVFPGHGWPTTVGHEKRHNPFVPAGAAR
jgi:glyoxylase-like metal-dependent hydrolase (beta-lactamase superfamily II)